MTDKTTNKFKSCFDKEPQTMINNDRLYDVINRDSGEKAGTFSYDEIQRFGYKSDHYLFFRVK